MPTTSQRCIECEEIELARVRDEIPSQVLPLPVAALEGLPEGRDSASLTRRRLLQGGVAGFASVYGSRLLGFEEVFEGAVAQAAPSDTNCLVLIYLAGGNDGLNVVLPSPILGSDQAAYVAARPSISRTFGPTIAGGRVGSQTLAGTDSKLALANVVLGTSAGGDTPLPGLEVLYGDGLGGAGSDLALLPSVDYTPSSFSHFDSSDYWFAGALTGLSTGWLGRWIDNNGSPTNPLQAVSLDTALSKAIRSASNPVCALPSTSSLGFSMRGGGFDMPPEGGSVDSLNDDMTAFAAVSANPQNLYLARARGAYDLAVDVAASGPVISGQAAEVPTYPPNAASLTDKLKLAAKLVQADLGTRVITIHWGAFDSHSAQIASQDRQLSQLAQSLAAFRADLQARGVEQKVCTLTFSEFGRRVGENGSAGTDHGAGGLMMLSGSKVRGGLAGEFPGCTSAALVAGNLKVTTDFRSVYQAVLDEWLGGNTAGVLPGAPFPAIQRYDGGNLLFK